MPGPDNRTGRVAQRESTPFTRVGSQVQSLSRPPLFLKYLRPSAGVWAAGCPTISPSTPKTFAREKRSVRLSDRAYLPTAMTVVLCLDRRWSLNRLVDISQFLPQEIDNGRRACVYPARNC